MLDRFPTVLAPPPTGEQQRLVATFASAGRIGGAIYDGLIAMTAKLAGLSLATADVRAVASYELVGVDVRHVG